jgi:sugar lactone lactonase YvrE
MRKEKTEDQADAPAPASGPQVIADVFRTPESILYDSAADVYLVANINGDPMTKDNNGFISRIGPDGTVQDATWIAGGVHDVELDAPKGMAIHGNTLLVADIDAIRAFDRRTGDLLASFPIAGATFLNDVATGPDGSIYFSDSGFGAGFSASGTDAIYRLGDAGAFTVVVKDASLGNPNGLCVDETGIVVVSFGSGEVYRIDPATGTRTDMPKPPAGQLDGVERLADGSLLVSSWEGSAVYRLIGEDAWAVEVDSVTSPADIGYDSKRGLVLIPSFMQHEIQFHEIK